MHTITIHSESAGWVLRCVECDKKVHGESVHYPSKEQAEAAAPAMLKMHARPVEPDLGDTVDFFSRDADNDATGGLWR